jgi:hypothetical protein
MAKPTESPVARTSLQELAKTDRRRSAASPEMEAKAIVPDNVLIKMDPSSAGCQPGESFTKKVNTPAQAAKPQAAHHSAIARCRYQVYGIRKMFTENPPRSY